MATSRTSISTMAGFVAACAVLTAPLLAQAQMGQGLIANPLLSPDKLKEVKRQIVESAHKELAPPPVAPPSPAMPPGMPPGGMSPTMMAGPGMPTGAMQPTISSDSARQMLSRLQVVTIMGDAAILAAPPPAAASRPQTGQMQMPGMPAGMPGAPQMMAGSALQSSDDPLVRRSSSITIRHGQKVLVEGIDVTATIRGDLVQLMLSAAPNAIVYQAGMQPAAYSPATAVAVAARERPSAEYVNRNKPDATSMSGTAGNMPSFPPTQYNQPSSNVGQPQRVGGY